MNLAVSQLGPRIRPMRRIGGSDIPKLLGISKYGGPVEVYDRIIHGVEPEWSKPMERGAMVEPLLRAHGQRTVGLVLEDMASEYADSPVHEFARAQIDDLARWQGIPVVAEYKSQSTFSRGWLHSPDGDRVPEVYEAQVAWQLMCTDRELAIVVVGFGLDTESGGFDLHNVASYEVARDLQFETYCVQVAKEFWEQHILCRVPPIPKAKKRRKAS